jgi:hypothetical protein
MTGRPCDRQGAGRRWGAGAQPPKRHGHLFRLLPGDLGVAWRLCGDAGVREDSAAPADGVAQSDRHDSAGDWADGSRAERRSGREAGAPSTGERAVGPGAGPGSEESGAVRPGTDTDESSVPLSASTRAGPDRIVSRSGSTPATTALAPPDPPPGVSTTTTTGAVAPPADDAGTGGLGGLLGGVFDLLGVG